MLSYQHSYHAGCLADVHKHAALSIMLHKLTEKDKALTYMETHAARGFYDLSAPEALKTGEAEKGIIALTNEMAIPKDHPYAKILAKTKYDLGPDFYPGSPLIAELSLRDFDQLILMELHPQEYAALKENMDAPNIHIHKRNGYEGVLALSPPTPRRGFVLIDPSYEVKTEYQEAAEFILKLHRKWAEATILLWYPILKASHHHELTRLLESANLPKYWHQEILFSKSDENQMQGSGLICINLPFGTEESLAQLKTFF